jgi:transposase
VWQDARVVEDSKLDISKILAPLSLEQIKSLSKDELIALLQGEQSLRLQFQSFHDEAKRINEELLEKKVLIEEQYVVLKNKFFGKSSERRKKEPQPGPRPKKKSKKKKLQKPSERYPNLPLIERDLSLETAPKCSQCDAQMTDSGMTESCEFLTVTPIKFTIIEQNRHKYRCPKCHADVKTTPAPPRICPGSAYSDEMILDVALSKYCDLIPIQRYVSIAERAGVTGLPPQSLIQLTHSLADFVKPVYQKIRDDILLSPLLHADETPHRMLEGGGDKKSWYLWGFSNQRSSYFEIHDTRSADVASKLLIQSVCQKLVSDKYSGYAKAVTDTNKQRLIDEKNPIENYYCNAHARRKFTDAETDYPEATEFIEIYQKIYRLEKIAQKRPLNRILRVRKYMPSLFEKMRNLGVSFKDTVSSKSLLAKAINYLEKNFIELTRFIMDPEAPIDNNPQERQLRNPVIGRKTWYGTHSRQGAETNAVLFTLVQSCKLCKVNPRQYFPKLVENIHAKRSPLTPAQFANLQTG